MAFCRWLKTGDEAFEAMVGAIDGARFSIRLESYIFAADAVGERFRAALVRASQRKVQVRVLVDAWGSLFLPEDYWRSLRAAGGEFRWFNPFHLKRFGCRDHRKLLVCDDQIAFVGGFNIAAEYAGDGVRKGWRDLGVQLKHAVARDLAASFDLLFAHADAWHSRLARWRKRRLALPDHRERPATANGQPLKPEGSLEGKGCALFLNGPAMGFVSFKRALLDDLGRAESVSIMTAYFLPTFRIRRALSRLARRGVRVQLILAGNSDVKLAQLACQRLYTSMLKAGIEIYEYQPQMLHAKLVLLEDCFYLGSANLDVRSLNINYELMLRIQEPMLAREAAEIFEQTKTHCRRVDLQQWRESRTFWRRLQEKWAFFILARLDPYFIRWQRRNQR